MKILWLIIPVLTLPAPAFADNHDVYGVWLTQAKDAHIKVEDCGDDTPCGTLIWIDPNKTDLENDVRNANIAMRDRPLIGVPIVWGYARGPSGWHRGHIYNPEDGKTFRSTMRLQDNGTLKVKGCLGPLCISNIWTPAPTRFEGH